VQLKKSAIEHALKHKLNCEVDEGKHRVFTLSLDGKVVAKTHTSHGGDEDIRDQLIKQMAQQMKVSKALFVEIVSCTKSRPDYDAEFRGA
jgi:hypothetical protein